MLSARTFYNNHARHGGFVTVLGVSGLARPDSAHVSGTLASALGPDTSTDVGRQAPSYTVRRRGCRVVRAGHEVSQVPQGRPRRDATRWGRFDNTCRAEVVEHSRC